MNFFSPTVELFYQENPSAPTEYILEAETWFDHSRFQTNGYDPIPTTLDANGDLIIHLLVLEDETQPDDNTHTLIEHTVNLGVLNFGVEEFWIEVTIYSEDSSGIRKKRGTTRTTSASAKEIGKPIE